MTATATNERTEQTEQTEEPRPLEEYLARSAIGGALVQLVLAASVGALATSRAAGHQLTPWTLAVVVAATAATGVCVGWPAGLYGGAADALHGLVSFDEDTDPAGDRWRTASTDELRAGRLWRNVGGWAAAAGLWALAGAVLVVVVLDGRRAGALVTIVTLAALGGVAGRAVDLAARRRGVELARSRPAASGVVPERRRAWLHLALPFGLTQLIVNAGFAWLLFHDYAVGDPSAPRPLLEGPVVAEVGFTVLVLVAVFAPLVRTWGEVDAALGRVELPAGVSLAAGASPVGPQTFVYLVLLGVVLGPVTGLLLPATPSLLRVALVRGGLAFLVVTVVTGLAHVRGALNRSAVAA